MITFIFAIICILYIVSKFCNGYVDSANKYDLHRELKERKIDRENKYK